MAEINEFDEFVDKADPKSVDQYLGEVDYSVNDAYVPSPFSLKYVNFIKLMTDGKGEASPTPVSHYKMLDLLPYASSVTQYQYIANLAARGTSKTSLFSEILFFYIAVFGEIDNFGKINAIIYVSDTIENGVKGLEKNMQARYDESEFLQKYIPQAIFNQTEIYMTNIDDVKLGIHMFGANTGIRGTKIMAKRPQLLVLDDLLSDKNAKSEGIIESIMDTLYKGANHALDPMKRKVVFNGTPFNQGDPLYSAIESGAWVSNVFPICEKFPCSREEFRGMWEERFDYDYVLNQYKLLKKNNQVHSFYQELMLQIISEDDRLVTDGDINWYDRAELLKGRHAYNIFITTDFATSAAKHADDSAISVWAMSSNRTLLWLDGILVKQTMDKNIDDLFSLVNKYKPSSVGVEINGQQGGFIPWIQREMISRGVFFTLAKSLSANGKTSRIGILSPTNKSKLERFNLMLPDIKEGKLFFPTSMQDTPIVKQAVNQLKGVTPHGLTAKHDDWLDTYSMIGLMSLYEPSDSGKLPSTDTDADNIQSDPEWARLANDDVEPEGNSYFI